jgi:hypothetical protein
MSKLRRILMSGLACMLALYCASCGSTAGKQIGEEDDRLPTDVVSFVRSADKVGLFSVHPGSAMGLAPRLEYFSSPYVWHYGIYGHVRLSTDEQVKVARLLNPGKQRGAQQAKCHIPRHALLAVKGQRYCILVICFECNNVRWVMSSLSESRPVPLYNNWKLKALLDRLLRDAGVTLAEDVNDKSPAELGE